MGANRGSVAAAGEPTRAFGARKRAAERTVAIVLAPVAIVRVPVAIVRVPVAIVRVPVAIASVRLRRVDTRKRADRGPVADVGARPSATDAPWLRAGRLVRAADAVLRSSDPLDRVAGGPLAMKGASVAPACACLDLEVTRLGAAG